MLDNLRTSHNRRRAPRISSPLVAEGPVDDLGRDQIGVGHDDLCPMEPAHDTRPHAEVMDDPPPEAFFLVFGENPLDFELRAWTRANIVQVSSDLRVGINAALDAAGIEMPFPQRDLHLRSVEESAAEKLFSQSKKDLD